MTDVNLDFACIFDDFSFMVKILGRYIPTSRRTDILIFTNLCIMETNHEVAAAM
jgi:hypothetical protein